MDDGTNTRLDAIEIRLEAMEARLEAVEARLEAVEARLEKMEARIEAMETRIMARMNGGFDRILDLIPAIRQDHDTTKGHVLYGLQENLTLSQRITKLEEELRSRR